MEITNLDAFEVSEEIVDNSESDLEEWFRRRSGKFTCSRFGDLMVRGRGKDEEWGQVALNYIYQVIGERLGSFTFPFDTKPTQWGKDNEPLALQEYCQRRDVDIEEVLTGTEAFIAVNDYCGGTPDGVYLPGCLEIKCPYTPQEHVRTMINKDIPKQYHWQVHGHLMLTGAEYCDFISFDPRIADERFRMVIIRVQRDEDLISQLRSRIEAAIEMVRKVTGE